MAKSKKTKRNGTLYLLFAFLSFALWFAPIATFTLIAILEGTLLYQKVSLAVTLFIVIIMTLVAVVNKVVMRSRLWIILIGVYICLHNIMTPLFVFAVCQIADELIVCPLKKRYKRKYQINKEIDGRL